MKFTEKLLSKNLYNKKQKTAVSIGIIGEETASLALKKKGYKIIDRNYRTKMGEIDIIAKDGDYTCFVEVRLRKTNDFGSPADTIVKDKQQKIIKTATAYAVKHNIYDTPMRFDVVLINADINGKIPRNADVEIIKDAFRM